jgi:hypothetical protein
MDASDPIRLQKALVPRGPSTYGFRARADARPGMTPSVWLRQSAHEFASRGTECARVIQADTLSIGGRREGRVQAAPMARLQNKSRRQSPQVRAEQPAFPARWLTGLYVLSPGTGFLAPVCDECASRIAQTAAPGGQDHTISPSVPGLFVRAIRSRCNPTRPSRHRPNVS